ncbi:glycoside hydrolase [Ornithinimicrobium cavernae]|uniref:glycoside hydrolase n=1 Tax=Ornithinimicrobium cavernae TaxID=2666047 RepID=UPI000D687E1B|nr:glycoside hydrolase [Ornithinimicrobium cavernae]
MSTLSTARKRSIPLIIGATVLVLGAALPPVRADESDPAAAEESVTITPFEQRDQAVVGGERQRIYDPSVGEAESWYVNDHTFVKGPDNGWHLFGITATEPAKPLEEVFFAHASAPSLTYPQWLKQDPVIHADPDLGETHVWAPHVIRHGRTYYMFYAGGTPDHTAYKMQLATSTDLVNWTRHEDNPLFTDGFDGRDPMVTRVGDQWVMYYTATSSPSGGNHIVAYRTSDDLLSWGPRQVAFTSPRTGTFGGPTESPFVVHEGGAYYLFVCCTSAYSDTRVFRSTDPFHFSPEDEVGQIAEHAAEVVRDGGRWWISGAGWGAGGVWLRPLNFDGERVTAGLRVQAPSYQATVQTTPRAEVTSMQVADGAGGWLPVLDDDYRATAPYLGVGGFGRTDSTSVPSSVTVSGRTVRLEDISMGDEPVTVDWDLSFGEQWFDSSVTADVHGPTTAPVWEVSHTVDSALPSVGDDTAPVRGTGDVSGFPRWTHAFSDTAAVATAYRAGSAFAEDNRYNAGAGAVVWQPLWQPGGRPWEPGSYPLGQLRIGGAPGGDGPGLGQLLHDSLQPAP